MKILNSQTIEQIEQAEADGDWNLVCMLLNKVQAGARSRYYKSQEQEIEEKIRQFKEATA